MERIRDLLIGTAVGDSLGLPREGLSARRAGRLYPGPLRQRLGMLSDDTEHAWMTAQALAVAPDDPARFARVLARKLRWWLVAMPPAIGFGTLRALVRLWLGFSPTKSGVRSAGNGAVMRAPVIGAWFDDPTRIAPFVAASTAITHRDPRAYSGALAVAIAAHHAARGEVRPATVLNHIRARVADRELHAALDRVEHALAAPTSALALALGLEDGITGYVHHTVPVCLHAWLRSPHDFRRAVEDVILLGGDADTTGAIVGALAGASAGQGAIPPEWIPHERRPWWPALPLRNMLLAAFALGIGVRRLLPPY